VRKFPDGIKQRNLNRLSEELNPVTGEQQGNFLEYNSASGRLPLRREIRLPIAIGNGSLTTARGAQAEAVTAVKSIEQTDSVKVQQKAKVLFEQAAQ
jgi:hypothetical protein